MRPRTGWALIVVAALVVVVSALGNHGGRTVATNKAVKVETVGRGQFELATIMHRGGALHPNLFRVMDVAKMRREGRAEWAKEFTLRNIAHGRRMDRFNAMGENPLVPDPTDKDTILELAKMSYNAYEGSNDTDDWYDLPGYDPEIGFGWFSDGLQGYIYVNENQTIGIVAIKGTSLLFLGQGGPTAEKDKIMDNLMFSCCCARVDNRWDPVCDCYDGGGTDENICNQSCLRETMTNSSLSYYNEVQEIYEETLLLYPNTTFWTTGHSLGASLASLLSVRNNIPAFAYEAPGELLYAQRLGLNIDTGDLGAYNVYHFGNLADPIFLGTCQGRASTCYISGYAMETRCHIGNVCLYAGGAVPNVNNHRIGVVIDRFIEPNDVPVCGPEVGCDECTDWLFV